MPRKPRIKAPSGDNSNRDSAIIDPVDRNRDRRGDPIARTPKILLGQRIRHCYRMILAGYSRNDILGHADDAVKDSWIETPDIDKRRKKEMNRSLWDICDRQIESAMARARALIEDQARTEQSALFNEVAAQINDLYLQSYKIQDYKTCNSVIKTKMELHRLGTMPLDPATAGAIAGAAAALTVQEWEIRSEQRRLAAATTVTTIAQALEKIGE